MKKYLAILLMFVSLPAFGQDIAEALVGRTTPARTSVDFLRYAQEVQAAAYAAAPVTRATTYYISTTGSDAAAGTIGAPWQTIDKVNDTLRDNVVTNTAFLFARNGVWVSHLELPIAPDYNGKLLATVTGSSRLTIRDSKFACGLTKALAWRQEDPRFVPSYLIENCRLAGHHKSCAELINREASKGKCKFIFRDNGLPNYTVTATGDIP